jgi:hypothetical protein
MNYGSNYTPTTAAPTTTAASVLTRNSNRRGLIIFNIGAVDVEFAADGVGYIKIPAGNHVAFVEDNAPANAIWAKTASGTGSLVIWER